ncbi:MAG TPA: DUF4136 domain-containing protein [Syntrophales bacterium]|nr:DUF4136 domain-containing protein [Syntrophales bacterium]
MRIFREDTWFGSLLAIIFGAGMFLGSCATTFNYSYDPVADFSKGKKYSWETGSLDYHQNPLIEKNVRYYADQSLKDKGFTLTSDKPDFVISTIYTLDYSDPYKVRVLNLYVNRTQGKELIWQGTADGSIKADAASPELAEAVKKILTNFPPKR